MAATGAAQQQTATELLHRETVIEVQNVTKIYPLSGATPAVDGVSLEIRRGEVTLLMGPSGSGKTTLISIMGGILRPTSGSVKIAGNEIADLSEKKRPDIRRKHIGFIFQSFNLVPTMTVAENVELALGLKEIHGAEARSVARELLDQVGLENKYDSFPSDLSGGQKQRVAIARALAGDPEIVLADEPTAALDSASGKVVMEMLSTLATQGRAVLIVTHDNRILEYADRIVEIEDGRIVSDRKPQKQLKSGEAAISTNKIISKEEEIRRRLAWELTRGKMLRRWVWGLSLLALVSLGLQFRGALFGSGKAASGGIEPQTVRAASTPNPAAGPPLVSGAGRVEPASEELKIGSLTPGRLISMPVREGQHLKRGQVIAVIENRDFAARVAQAEANVSLQQAALARLDNGAGIYEKLAATTAVAEAKMILDNARAELEHRRSLLRGGDVSQADYDRAEREVKLAKIRFDKAQVAADSVSSPAREDERARLRAGIQAAKAQLSEAQALLSKTVIRAPFDGVVLKRFRQAGEEVGMANDPVIAFGDVSRLVVRVDVDETDVAKIQVGDAAYVTAQAYGAERFRGKVVQIGRQLGKKNIETGDPMEKVDTRVLETLVQLEGTPPLPVGLRVDSFIETRKD